MNHSRDKIFIDGAWVPAAHCFAIDPACATAPGPLYRFPFMPLAFVTLGANLLGGMVMMAYLHHAMRAETPLAVAIDSLPCAVTVACCRITRTEC